VATTGRTVLERFVSVVSLDDNDEIVFLDGMDRLRFERQCRDSISFQMVMGQDISSFQDSSIQWRLAIEDSVEQKLTQKISKFDSLLLLKISIEIQPTMQRLTITKPKQNA
jgi:hypothetical protein